MKNGEGFDPWNDLGKSHVSQGSYLIANVFFKDMQEHSHGGV